MQISDNARGAIYMMISMAAFTLNDTAMKAVTQSVPLFQAIALRGCVAVVGLMLIAQAMGGIRLRLPRHDAGAVAIRSLAEIFSTVLFLAALKHMPLANLSAILQSLPLAVTLAAALLYREPIGWRRLVAILIGFVGVLIIIRPGPEGFDIWSLMGLGSVLFVVVRDLATRSLSRDVASTTVAIWAAITVTCMGVIGSGVEGWSAMTLRESLLILGAAGMLILGYLFAVMVMRVGDIGFIAPFRYTALLWAIFLGWLMFGILPDPWTLFGAALVVATGIFTLWRERRLRLAAVK